MKKNLVNIIIAVAAAIMLIVSTIFLTNNQQNTTENTQIDSQKSVIQSDIDKNIAITFKDPELEKIIREIISKPDGDIFTSDMEQVQLLNINYKETPVTDISGLEYAYKLGNFSYRYGTLDSLDPIRLLPELSYLNVSYSDVNQPTKAFSTPNLERISFIDTNISDCDFLKGAINATDVTVTDSGLSSIDFVSGMSNLQTLNISTNNVSDISALKNKVKLTSVTFHQNQISDISALATSPDLEDVNISYNHVTNLEPLSKLSKLQNVRAYEDLDKKIIDRGQIESFIGKGVGVDYHK